LQLSNHIVQTLFHHNGTLTPPSSTPPSLVEVCKYLYANGELPQKNYRSLLSKEVALYVLGWIKGICPLGWKPYSLRTYVLSGTAYKFNKLLRTESVRKICGAFAEHQKRSADIPGTFRPGRDTLRKFLKYVTERTRKKACLSYYYVRLIETFEMYERLITQCESDQEEAVNAYDKIHPCQEAQKFIRTKLITSKARSSLLLAQTQYPPYPLPYAHPTLNPYTNAIPHLGVR
jgi:hypothetical protein